MTIVSLNWYLVALPPYLTPCLGYLQAFLKTICLSSVGVTQRVRQLFWCFLYKNMYRVPSKQIITVTVSSDHLMMDNSCILIVVSLYSHQQSTAHALVRPYWLQCYSINLNVMLFWTCKTKSNFAWSLVASGSKSCRKMQGSLKICLCF